MITLRDTIEIRTSPEKIFGFFIHFKENFMAWHPDRHFQRCPLMAVAMVQAELSSDECEKGGDGL